MTTLLLLLNELNEHENGNERGIWSGSGASQIEWISEFYFYACAICEISRARHSLSAFFPPFFTLSAPLFFPYSNDNCWGRSIILIFAKHQSFFPFLLFTRRHSFSYTDAACVYGISSNISLASKLTEMFRETGYRVGSVWCLLFSQIQLALCRNLFLISDWYWHN